MPGIVRPWLLKHSNRGQSGKKSEILINFTPWIFDAKSVCMKVYNLKSEFQ